MPKPKAKKHLSEQQKEEQLGKMLVRIYETGYLDSNTAYKQTFFKGVLAGLGGVIGATIVVALLLWFLTLFNEIPLIGDIAQKVTHTVQQGQ